MAAALGVSEQAARRRLSRAVGRMRRYFAAGGVALTPAALSAAFAHPPEPPPDDERSGKRVIQERTITLDVHREGPGYACHFDGVTAGKTPA